MKPAAAKAARAFADRLVARRGAPSRLAAELERPGLDSRRGANQGRVVLPPFPLSLAVPRFRPALLVAALLTAAASPAQDRPPGAAPVVRQTVPPGQARAFSLPLATEPSSLADSVGRLTAVGPAYLENAAARWVPGAFASVEAPYLVRITSGRHAGRVFPIIPPANSATRLHVATDGLDLTTLGLETGAGAAGYAIIPGDTLATFFGPAGAEDSPVLHGAPEAAAADIVQVWDGAAWLNFYYHTIWRRWARDTDTEGDPARNHFLLRPDRGLLLVRRGATPLHLAVPGPGATAAPRSPLPRAEQSRAFLATGRNTDLTLGELALQNDARFADWRGAADPREADLVQVWGGAAWFTFFYHPAAGHWQRIGDPANRDGYVIKAGAPVLIQRRARVAPAEVPALAPPAADWAPGREQR